MRTSDFDYDLPPELIAQERAEPPEAARLLVLDRSSSRVGHRQVRDLPDLLQPGDVLVFNNSRVIPARLVGRKPTGGRVEVLLVRPVDREWLALTRPGLRIGQTLSFGANRAPQPLPASASASGASQPSAAARLDRQLAATVTGDAGDGLLRLAFDVDGADFRAVLAALGSMPIPPYIKRALRRPEEYQTVYAEIDGSVAAPTAGFHFSSDLLGRLAGRGVQLEFLTLHVGPGTFRPVKVDDVEQHRLHAEWFTVPEATAERLAAVRREGRRLIAVGTTAVRALESAATPGGCIRPTTSDTRLFIYPGHRFRVVDGLITNFHLPRSTLLMLVCAFAGREAVLSAYGQAVTARYRFYSFGDGMFIV